MNPDFKSGDLILHRIHSVDYSYKDRLGVVISPHNIRMVNFDGPDIKTALFLHVLFDGGSDHKVPASECDLVIRCKIEKAPLRKQELHDPSERNCDCCS